MTTPFLFVPTFSWPAAPGGLLYTYAATTTTPKATYSDAAGAVPNANPVVLDSLGSATVRLGSGSYKFVLKDSTGATTLWTQDNYSSSFLTASDIGQLLYPQTAAETAASVTPTNYAYPPGDIRRYGAVAASDITAALANAVAQAVKSGGSSVYIPSALGTGCTITAGVSVTAPITIYGDNYYQSVISTASDITIFSVTLAGTGSVIRDLQLIGKGAGATLPGVLYTNSAYNILTRVYITGFGVGVRYAPGINSSYLNSIFASKIISNNTINIDAKSETNSLSLHGVTFGGASQIGISVVDSGGLAVYGGDCEGCTVCAIDIDATSALFAHHLFSGVDLENTGATRSAGDVRIGNTATCRGITFQGCEFAPGGTTAYGLNVIRCDGLSVLGCSQVGGYVTSFLNRGGALTNYISLGNSNEVVGFGTPLNHVGNNFDTGNGHPQNWNPPSAFDANYQAGASANQYAVLSTDLNVANGHWFAGLDILNVGAGSAPSAGVIAAARAFLVNNAFGGTFAYSAYFNGAPFRVDGQATTGAQTATFTATNKPGSGTTAPTKWLPVNLDGTTYYIPCWT